MNRWKNFEKLTWCAQIWDCFCVFLNQDQKIRFWKVCGGKYLTFLFNCALIWGLERCWQTIRCLNVNFLKNFAENPGKLGKIAIFDDWVELKNDIREFWGGFLTKISKNENPLVLVVVLVHFSDILAILEQIILQNYNNFELVMFWTTFLKELSFFFEKIKKKPKKQIFVTWWRCCRKYIEKKWARNWL